MTYPDQSQLKHFKPQSGSPFHRAEQLIQSHLGIRDRMEQFGQRVIRDFFPEQHRQFYREQAYILAGHLDEEGWPWAAIIAGKPGFISSPNIHELHLDTALLPNDRLQQALKRQRSKESDGGSRALPMGFMGVDLESRRRNRFSAYADFVHPDSQVQAESSLEVLRLGVQQSFGNCPQYIQKRSLNWLDGFDPQSSSSKAIQSFGAPVRNWIEQADTLFVSSANRNRQNLDPTEAAAPDGIDVSHRGGQPGFVKVEDDTTLVIPDYAGNYHFNTFGNFLEYPRAGLLFVDFEQRRLLQLTGTVEILWDDPRTKHFDGAERLWQFRLHEGWIVEDALPFSFTFEEFSPNSLLTSTWQRAERAAEAQNLVERWQSYRVISTRDESDVIRSFHLESASGTGQPIFLPGQFLNVRVPSRPKRLTGNVTVPTHSRTYSVSSSPWDDGYRISVKKESDGRVSNYLHKQIQPGDLLEVKVPQGGFYMDLDGERPAILLAGGVGITPMVSMARASYHHRIKTRGGRELTLFAAARSMQQRAFHDELTRLSGALGETFNYYSVLSRPEPSAKPGRDYHYKGYIDPILLQSVLPLDDYDVYLCGPEAFMQGMYDLVTKLGIPDHRIFAESFGPAALQRRASIAVPMAALEQAAAAEVSFVRSGVEQLWTPEQGSLLEFAEGHGLEPEFSCRGGSCGACKTKIVSGRVVQTIPSKLPLEKDEVLLCCSVPGAPDDAGKNPRIELDL